MRSKNKSYFHFLVIKNNNIKNKKYYKTAGDIMGELGIPKQSIYNIIEGKCLKGKWSNYYIEKIIKPIYTITEINYDEDYPTTINF
tara:strand:+ start:677 stop:934 length:258 start_codon:yes stop_codon:yes gene_type:complete